VECGEEYLRIDGAQGNSIGVPCKRLSRRSKAMIKDGFALFQGMAGGTEASVNGMGFDDKNHAGQSADGGIAGDRGMGLPFGIGGKFADQEQFSV